VTAPSFLPEESTEVLQQRLIGALEVQGDYRKRIRRARIHLAWETIALIIVVVAAICMWASLLVGLITFGMIGNARGDVPGYFVVAIAWIVLWRAMGVTPKSQNADRKKVRDRLVGMKAFLETGEQVVATLNRQIAQRGAAGGE
jgi:hypothetical protein